LSKDNGVLSEENYTLVPKVSSLKSRKHSKGIRLTSPKKTASTVACMESPLGCQNPPRRSDLAGGVSHMSESFSRLRL
jgi:hypothetical protein